MDAIIATSEKLLTMNLDTGWGHVLDTGRGPYFGIGMTADKLWIAARHRPVDRMNTLRTIGGKILAWTYDGTPAASLEAPFLLRDLHHILWIGETLLATCPYDNGIAIGRQGQWDWWFPVADGTKDFHHWNSLAYHDGDLFVLAHNWGASRVYQFTWPSLHRITAFPLGHESHNLWWDQGRLFTCSSRDGEIRSLGDHPIIRTGQYPRGVAVLPDRMIIGLSLYQPPPYPAIYNACVLVYDRQGHYQHGWILPGVNQLNDIRVPGAHDAVVTTHRGHPFTVPEGCPVFQSVPVSHRPD